MAAVAGPVKNYLFEQHVPMIRAREKR